MTSWWRLRTQAYLVLSVLLFLIAFLGAYALSEAKRHADEADELFGANFVASSILKQIETARNDELRTAAKFRVTRDEAYASMSNKQREQVDELLKHLLLTVGDDEFLAPLVRNLSKLHQMELSVGGRPMPSFTQDLRELERRLESQRTERADRLRAVARDLDKIIFVAFLIAIGVTSWLGVMLYLALLKPLESIKQAARRIREGELSYRIEKFRGFEELSELRREFNAMASKLEELDSMKGDFLSTVSHELRTPLTALKEGLAFLSEKQGSVPAPLMNRTLEVCNQAAKRLETMIQNLLNHAKMESGFYSFDERPKDFASVLESAIQGVKPIAERRGLVIEFKVICARVQASFSTEGITHAIENLLLNAIKYGDAAHPILVEVARLESGPVPYLEVRVTNHGKGLLPAELKLVFERFFRASNADGQKGVGLGLSVVKRIIEAHHGTVSAESENGKTTFTFRIPQRYETEGQSRDDNNAQPRRAPHKGAQVSTALLLVVAVASAAVLPGCSFLRAAQGGMPRHGERGSEKKLARIALEMLDPQSSKYNPERGKAYLEYSLRQGTIKSVDVPASAMLELLKSDRVASEKSRSLEQQLEIMKEIDMTRGEEL